MAGQGRAGQDNRTVNIGNAFPPNPERRDDHHYDKHRDIITKIITKRNEAFSMIYLINIKVIRPCSA
jgi:hypothetical protein